MPAKPAIASASWGDSIPRKASMVRSDKLRLPLNSANVLAVSKPVTAANWSIEYPALA